MPTALERAGDFSQSVDSSGNPFPYIRDYQLAQANPTWGCSATDQRACFADGGVLGRIPQNRLYANGLAALNIFPHAQLHGGQRRQLPSQEPSDRPRREDLIRLDFQPSDKWRFTGRYMNTNDNEVQAYGTTWAGSGSDQLPMPVLHPIPGRNWMLSSTGILNTTTSIEVSVGAARNALTYELQSENLFRSAAGLTGFPYLYPEAPQGDYIPYFQFRGGRTGNAGQYQTNQGPFVNENKTFDAIANLTKIWGNHAAKFGVYFQSSYKAQSNFASFNIHGQLRRQRAATPTTRGTATRTRRPGSSTPTSRPTSSRIRSTSTRTSSGTARTTGRSTRGSPSTTASASTT